VKIVVAPDKFKGSLTAVEAARAMERGARRARTELHVVACPIADGGEGSLDVAFQAGFERVEVTAPGPHGQLLQTSFARNGTTALVEMADVSGLQRIPSPSDRRPLEASSRGLGVVIRAAIDAGCNSIIVGIGGSACTDGGAGMLTALGAQIADAHGQPISDGGRGLMDAETLNLGELASLLQGIEIIVASDVDNPLCGPHGAAHVYGPQKGATTADVEFLDLALTRWADLVAGTIGRDLREAAGAGAAGGVGFAAIAVLGATHRPGAELLLEMLDLPQKIEGADAVITGEGSLDHQSLRGKAPIAVARIASALGVPTHAIVGVSSISEGERHTVGFDSVEALRSRARDDADAMARAAELVEQAANDVVSRLPQSAIHPTATMS
jgi:glycerate kinase